DVREGALDDGAEDGRDLVGRPVQPSFVGELEADAVVLDPADGAFDRPVITEMKVHSVPQHGLKRAGDHRPAAGKIDQLDRAIGTVVSDARRLAGKPVAVFIAVVSGSAHLARNPDGFQAVRPGTPLVLGFEQRLLNGFDAAVNLRPDVHALTPTRECARDASTVVTESCTSLQLGSRMMPMGGKGRWEGSPHRRPERMSLP